MRQRLGQRVKMLSRRAGPDDSPFSDRAGAARPGFEDGNIQALSLETLHLEALNQERNEASSRGRRARRRQRERGVPGARKTLRSKKSNSKERPAEWSAQIRWTYRLSSTRGREECRPGQGRCRRSAARGGDGIRSGASGG